MSARNVHVARDLMQAGALGTFEATLARQEYR
jgi:hypothetical protein